MDEVNIEVAEAADSAAGKSIPRVDGIDKGLAVLQPFAHIDDICGVVVVVSFDRKRESDGVYIRLGDGFEDVAGGVGGTDDEVITNTDGRIDGISFELDGLFVEDFPRIDTGASGACAEAVDDLDVPVKNGFRDLEVDGVLILMDGE